MLLVCFVPGSRVGARDDGGSGLAVGLGPMGRGSARGRGSRPVPQSSRRSGVADVPPRRPGGRRDPGWCVGSGVPGRGPGRRGFGLAVGFGPMAGARRAAVVRGPSHSRLGVPGSRMSHLVVPADAGIPVGVLGLGSRVGARDDGGSVWRSGSDCGGARTEGSPGPIVGLGEAIVAFSADAGIAADPPFRRHPGGRRDLRSITPRVSDPRSRVRPGWHPAEPDALGRRAQRSRP